jgi:TonB family protein
MRTHRCSLIAALALLGSGQPVVGPAMAQTPAPDGFTPPVPLSSHAVTIADYPRESVLQGEQGVVVLRFLVAEMGNVSECNIESSSGYPSLDTAACAAARRWKYKPASQSGQPASSLETADLIFRISSILGRANVREIDRSSWDATVEIPASFKPPPAEPTSKAATEQARLLLEGYTPPQALTDHQVSPSDYPWDAVRANEQGIVVVLYLVTEAGDVSECGVLASSGSPRLDEGGCAVARRWKFKPATQYAKPTSPFVKANIVFQLH